MCSCDSSRCQANGGHLCAIIWGGWKKEWMIQLDHNDIDYDDDVGDDTYHGEICKTLRYLKHWDMKDKNEDDRCFKQNSSTILIE